ncbi:Nop14-like protein [Gigaspora margarita]|uniref:Nop14-like protein n=2 Tax=Gigaspora margarita TaxID=4874 RepID=A0A8H4A8T4_GIGMA|nr:Nop14-like protein [Gigaspora margarita]
MAKSGGSALKRLKSTLKEAKVIGHGSRSSMSKKQKRKGKPKDDKNDTKDKLEFLKNQINPFELRVTKTKHNVLGRKVKGIQGRPGLKRQIGIEKRKQTLLVEMESRNKVGGLIDRRFGENDPTLSLEEKMLERFAREKKQRHSKSSLFNLEDDDLTHYGQSLTLIDDFDEPDLSLNEEVDTGIIDQDTVDKGHFGGFEEDEQNNDESEHKKKSKTEVMKEVIAKSKMHKYERQLVKEEDERVCNELDNDLDEIRNLISLPKSGVVPLPTQEAAFRNKSVSNGSASKKDISDKDDAYDRHVRELALDRRTRPTDRIKSEEEIALEEKEKLERLEIARKRRMEGLDPESDDDSVKRKKQKRTSMADDPDYDHISDDDDNNHYNLGKGISLRDDAAIEQAQDEDTSDDEDGDEDDEDENDDDIDDYYSDLDLEASDDNQILSDDNNDTSIPITESDHDTIDLPTNSKNLAVKHGITKTKDKCELAYTFPCPTTLAEFLKILQDVEDEEVHVVVHRIRVLHHIKLSVENRVKLEKFFPVLMDYVLHRVQENPVPILLINKLVGHIFDLVQQVPESATDYFVSKIVTMENNLTKRLFSSGLKKSKSMFPTISEFILLRILSQVFPTSDFHHPVVTPAQLLMAQYLAQCPLSNGLDLVSGLLLCNLMHECQILSKRIIPEALNFLFIALVYLAPQGTFNSMESIPGIFPLSSKFVPTLQIKDTTFVDDANPLDFSQFSSVMNGNGNINVFDNDLFRLSALMATLHLVENFAKMYNCTPASSELFEPASKIIDTYPLDKFSSTIKIKIASIRETLERLQKFSKKSRKPLELQHHRPIPLPTYIPKFQENFSIDKHYDTDREQAKLNKLKAQYKKERKGAIRELRKDSKCIAHHNIRKVKEKDTLYKKRINSIMGILESEQGEKKAYEKAKKYGKI